MVTELYKLICPQCGYLELTGKSVELIKYRCKKCKREWFTTFYAGIFLITDDVEIHKRIHDFILGM